MTATQKPRCRALYYPPWSFRSVECGKPMKGIRTMPDDTMVPVCGVHLRTSRFLVNVAPGRASAIRPKVKA